GEFHLRINTDAPTSGVWIDDLKLEEGEQASYCEPPEPDRTHWIVFDTAEEELFVEDDWSVQASVHVPESAGRTVLKLFAAGPSEIEVTGAQRVLQPGLHVVRISGYSDALHLPATLRLVLEEDGTPRASASYTLVVRSAQGARDVLASLRKDASDLRQALDAVKARGVDTAYPEVTLTLLEEFSRYVAEDIRHREYRRAWEQIKELQGMAQRLRAELSAPRPQWPEVPRWLAGAVQIRGPSFVGQTARPSRGAQERRPVIFTGYGHFGQVRADLEKLPRLGTNIIQIELGPSAVFPADGVVDRSPIEQLARDYERAARAGVAICQLISPHYMPDWFLDKHPHLKVRREGFIQYCLHAPEGLELMDQFLRVLLGAIGRSPALHSVCLSNEPVNVEDPACPYGRRLWQKWLTKRHRTIARLNELWGTSYASFDEVPVPQSVPHPDPLHYEYVLFNQEFFAGWHKHLADIVHRYAPDVPVHAKAMTWTFLSHLDLRCGVDPELFGRFSQINGNDSVNFYAYGRGEWAHSWQQMAMGHDLQRSVLDAPVVNSENHLIRDRETRPVPPEHMRTALWQAAVHGQSATAIWVWERTYDLKSDFAGSVVHRPACAEAVGRIGLDLMRLSHEVTALQKAPADVLLLYSTTSMVYDGADYTDCLSKAYTALSFTGLKVGFVTERQLAAGRVPKARLLVVPCARHLPDSARRALRRYGGNVLLLGDGCLGRDDYGRPRTVPEGYLIGQYVRGRTTERDLLEPILLALDVAGVHPLVQLTSADGKTPWGVEWRCARYRGRVLVNVVNYLNYPVDVKVTTAGFDKGIDLLSGAVVEEMLRLEPLKPMLVQYTQ
ncbi:MAG: beta-galactosidase, partial [Armatimonadota bacterium]